MHKTPFAIMIVALALLAAACGDETATREDFVAFVIEDGQVDGETAACIADEIETDGTFSFTTVMNADEGDDDADEILGVISDATFSCLLGATAETTDLASFPPAEETSTRDAFLNFWTGDGTPMAQAECVADWIESEPAISFSAAQSFDLDDAVMTALWNTDSSCA